MIAINKLDMQGRAAQNKKERGSRKPNGGRGSPGNTLDQRQKDESPLGYTLGQRRKGVEISIKRESLWTHKEK